MTEQRDDASRPENETASDAETSSSDAAPAASSTPAPTQRGGGGFAHFLSYLTFLLLLLVVAGLLTAPRWVPQVADRLPDPVRPVLVTLAGETPAADADNALADKVAALEKAQDSNADLQKALTALQDRVATLEKGQDGPDALSALQKKVSDLESQVADLNAPPDESSTPAQPPLATAVKTLEQSVQSLSQQVTDLETASPSGAAQNRDTAALGERLATLDQKMQTATERLDTLQQQVSALRDKSDTTPLAQSVQSLDGKVAAVSKRVDTLSATVQAVAPLAAGPKPAEVAQSVTTVRSTVSELQKKMAPLLDGPTPKALAEEVKTTQAGVTKLDQQVSALEGTIKPLAEGPTPKALAGDLASLKQTVADVRRGSAEASTVSRLQDQVQSLDKSLSSLHTGVERANALLIAGAQLRAMVERGAPYTSELNAVKVLGQSHATVEKDVAVLAPHADTGLPTRQQLRDRFAQTLSESAQAAHAPTDGWVQTSLARLAGVVTIRPSGDNAQGTGPLSVLARAEAKVKAGDLAGAATLLQKELKDGPAKAAHPWIQAVDNRLAAEKALDDLTQYALTLAESGRPKNADSPDQDAAKAPAPKNTETSADDSAAASDTAQEDTP